MEYFSNSFVDSILGPLQNDSITTFYGSPGAGKSTLSFQYCCDVLKKGKKVIFIDTEGGFSSERILQIDPSSRLENILVMSPKSFENQHKIISSLLEKVKSIKDIGLIIVDSLVMLYRLKLGDSPQKINKELGEQLRLLNEISRVFKIPIVVVNQMYIDFNTGYNKMVGGSVLEYWSKTILELDKVGPERFIKLTKHKFKQETKSIKYVIKNKGLEKI